MSAVVRPYGTLFCHFHKTLAPRYAWVSHVHTQCGELQEILGTSWIRCRDMSVPLRYRREDGELGIQVFPKVHDRGNVSAAVAVVGCGPDSHHRLVFEMPLFIESVRYQYSAVQKETHLVAFIYQLVGSRNQLEAIDMIEFRCHLVPE